MLSYSVVLQLEARDIFIIWLKYFDYISRCLSSTLLHPTPMLAVTTMLFAQKATIQ
jgi:hypothetical protein